MIGAILITVVMTMNQTEDFLNAVTKGEVEKVRALLAVNPAMARTTDTKGVSAVLKAKYHGKQAVVDVLLATGLELNIFEASATGQTSRLRELVSKDPSLVNSYAVDGFFPLALAAFFGHKDAVEVLLASGADVNMQSRESMKVSALHSASAARRMDIAELLLVHGANPNLRGENGFTPLHEAAATGQTDLALLLIKHGASVNAKDDSGKTPLTFALERKQDRVAEILRQHGGT